MKNKPFRFKQFDIYQDQTAMKVGTDGVLLGAWATLYTGNQILDIGSGTGLISLMLAQRFSDAFIAAVELDTAAYNQAKENFLNSKFRNQLKIHHLPIQELEETTKFDLIVSNPPFFIGNDRVEFDARKKARQQETLTFEELLLKSARLLDEKGSACYIIPYDLESNFLEIAESLQLFPSKILHVKGNYEAETKRSLIELKFNAQELEEDELIIEIERHQYTQEYINLTKEYYLKM